MRTALNLGDHARAAASFEEALMMSQASGRRPTVINTLEEMVSLAGAMGEAARAAQLWGAAEAAREVTDIALPPGERALHEPFLAAARSRLGDAGWEKALAKGRVMPLDEAAEYALAKDVETAAPTNVVPEGPLAGELASVLTRREREITILVAQGLTNRQISSRLGISERTAANHVGINNVVGIAVGARLAWPLRSNGTVWAWGSRRTPLSPPMTQFGSTRLEVRNGLFA